MYLETAVVRQLNLVTVKKTETHFTQLDQERVFHRKDSAVPGGRNVPEPYCGRSFIKRRKAPHPFNQREGNIMGRQ